MSHTVTIVTKVHDTNAVAAACQRLNCPPAHGTARLYGGARRGCSSSCASGSIPWSSTRPPAHAIRQFQRRVGLPGPLGQIPPVVLGEKARLEAQRQHHRVVEQELPSGGTIRLQIIESQ